MVHGDPGQRGWPTAPQPGRGSPSPYDPTPHPSPYGPTAQPSPDDRLTHPSPNERAPSPPPGTDGVPGGPDARPRRRRLLVAGAAAVAVVAAVTGGIVLVTTRDGGPEAGTQPGTGAPPSSRASATTAPPLMGWLSGASSDVAAQGREDGWRATPIAIGGTWDNGNSEQVTMHTICPGGPWASWNRALDVAIGAIDVDRGETWAAAARGAYTSRWTTNLQKIKQCWGSRDPGLLYIRFAHEMNLAASTWRVRGGEEASFAKAITLYSNLRYQILPQARIVLCPNDGTQAQQLGGLDIRKLWPGKDAQGRPVADVYAVDSYNMSPHVNTVADFQEKINGEYDDGMPLGIEKHRQQAQKWGVPFAIGEWSNSGDPDNQGGGGESPLYVQQFFAWARSHAGDINHPVPGQLLYELHFNLWDQYAFWPTTQQPRTAAAYRALPWGKP